MSDARLLISVSASFIEFNNFSFSFFISSANFIGTYRSLGAKFSVTPRIDAPPAIPKAAASNKRLIFSSAL